MRSSKGTPTQQRKDVEEKQKPMSAGELTEFVKKSMITAYTNLVNGPTDFDNVVAFFVAQTTINDALKNAIVADRAQDGKLTAAVFDAMNGDEVARQKAAFLSADIQTNIASLEVVSQNVEVPKNLAKVGRDVHSVRRQVCTVVFSDGDRSITCIQAELKKAEVLAKLKEQFDAKVKALNPEAAAERRPANM